MDAGSVQSRLAAEMESIKAKAEAEQAKATAEEDKARADQAKATAATGSNYQQKTATTEQPKGAAPNPMAITKLVETANEVGSKHMDLENKSLYTEPVLYGIINHPDTGPELLGAARAELARRRGIAPNGYNASTATTTIPGSTGTRVDSTPGQPAGTAVPGRPADVQQAGSNPGGPAAGTAAVGNQQTTQPVKFEDQPLADAAPDDVFAGVQSALYKKRGVIIRKSPRPLNYQQRTVSKLARMMGKTITWVEQANGKTDDMPNGMVNNFAGNHFFMDVNSTHPALEIIMHEGVHALPDHIRKKLVDVVLKNTSDAGKAAFIKRYGYGKESKGTQDEEITAYVTQRVAANPRFFQDLRKALGNKDFAELARVIISKVKAWMNNADEFDANFLGNHVSNLQEVHDAAVEAYSQAMKEMGVQPDPEVAGPVASNKPVEETASKAVEDQDGEPDDSRETITQKDIPESVDAPATLESALKLAGSKVWNKGRDLKVAIQDAVQAAAKEAGVDVGAPSDATTKYLVRVGTKDALAALKQNANAVGWYDLKTRQALAVMALVHPELAHDENARFAMVWAMAVTSNGLKVGKNFEIAEKVYEEYKRTGEMPANMGIGNAAKAINQSLALFNELKEAWGIDNLRKFMLTNFTVKEITGINKELKPGGEHADVVVKGAAILGPKIGNGFFSNLYGNFDALTMDRWLVRTWGRWSGTLISPLVKQTAKARERLQANLAEIVKDKGEADRLSEAIGLQIKADMPLEDLANAVQKASMEPAIRKQMNATSVGEEMRKAGNGLAKYLDGQKEAPAGPTERKYIRKVFGEILSDLRKTPEYKDLQMADLQAVLWYAEKRLYESAKEDPSDEEVAGYSDSEAPDYANAAADVARSAGVSDRKIKNALTREEQNGRTGTARSTDEQTEPDRFGLPPAPGSFTSPERKQFVTWQALKRIGSLRANAEESSWAYEREAGKDAGRVRRLGSTGATYVNEWRLGQKAKNVLKANSLQAVSLYELTPKDAASAQVFADAITDSKESTEFGAAVYVYPTQSSEDETGYADMKLFLTKDGLNGVAVKSNGDIVSVFSQQRSGNSLSLLQVALAAGGRKLDAFDTVLPDIYGMHGFRAISRIPWNDDPGIKPPGWDKDVFSEFNGGEPDVVFMAYDPSHGRLYQAGDGKAYDDYMKAVNAQTRAVNKVAKTVPSSGPVFSNKPQNLDQDITLEIPVEGGRTAKLTVNAASYMKQLDARQEALQMVKECMA
ncbi:MAG: hypothetical protein CGW95_12205 [Phenylobacterium zucineum]|nr:MAG: hypothetical protein CGW95_12205 [Phenylobacterium zucineum]